MPSFKYKKFNIDEYNEGELKRNSSLKQESEQIRALSSFPLNKENKDTTTSNTIVNTTTINANTNISKDINTSTNTSTSTYINATSNTIPTITHNTNISNTINTDATSNTTTTTITNTATTNTFRSNNNMIATPITKNKNNNNNNKYRVNSSNPQKINANAKSMPNVFKASNDNYPIKKNITVLDSRTHRLEKKKEAQSLQKLNFDELKGGKIIDGIFDIVLELFGIKDKIDWYNWLQHKAFLSFFQQVFSGTLDK